jgi:hypothetical protein
MKITGFTIRNYRSIEERCEAVPGAGAIVKGRNGGGKTSVLNAIRAALIAQDVGPDAIRLGADKAEILLDLDDVTIRRLITPKSTSLTVTSLAGVEKRAPQTFLTQLLGMSAIDPIDIIRARTKDERRERRTKILRALPCTVRPDQMMRWIPGDEAAMREAATFDWKQHGLDVCQQIRDHFYAKRTTANSTLKTASDAVKGLEAQYVEMTLDEGSRQFLRQAIVDLSAAAERLPDRRERIATAILGGISADPSVGDLKIHVAGAVSTADALIAELDSELDSTPEPTAT